MSSLQIGTLHMPCFYVGICGYPCVDSVQDLVESISVMNDSNNDWFLVAPDFTDYMRAQASACPSLPFLCSCLNPASKALLLCGPQHPLQTLRASFMQGSLQKLCSCISCTYCTRNLLIRYGRQLS